MKKNRDDLFKHSRKRAISRYGLELTRGEYEKFNGFIRTNDRSKVYFLARESNTRTHWLVCDIYICVYNTQLNTIATFLPPDAIWNYTKDSEYFKLRKQIKGYEPFED